MKSLVLPIAIGTGGPTRVFFKEPAAICGSSYLIMASCYILHSSILDKFYIGATRHDADVRTLKHNSAFYGSSFTSKVSDWKILLEIPCTSFEQTLKIEKPIKKMKSSAYIKNLIEYPEIIRRKLYP